MTTGPAGVPGLASGRLLVATPLLLDPNFARSVVLLLDHDEGGSLGVVLNRPSPVPVHSILADWSDASSAPPVLFQGGPVGTDSALAVAAVAAGGSEPIGFRRFHGDLGLVDLDTPVQVLAPAVSALRIFAGYAGWGPGQLAGEVELESWYVVPSVRDDVFGAGAEDLWRDVLRRQPGELAWVSTMPADPSLN